MSNEQKNNWLIGIYRGGMSIAMISLIFQSGQWKQEIEDRTLTVEQKYEVIGAFKGMVDHTNDKTIHFDSRDLEDNYVTREEYEEVIDDLRTALKRIETKVDKLGAEP